MLLVYEYINIGMWEKGRNSEIFFIVAATVDMDFCNGGNSSSSTGNQF